MVYLNLFHILYMLCLLIQVDLLKFLYMQDYILEYIPHKYLNQIKNMIECLLKMLQKIKEQDHE